MKCKRSWLTIGIITGFLTGALHFAYGVYTHRTHHVIDPMGSTHSQYHSQEF